MKLYNCNVTVGGDHCIEVPKLGVTEHEINLLRHLHGLDMVGRFKVVGEVERTAQQELNNLAVNYGTEVVERVFGVRIASFAPVVEDADDYVDLPANLNLEVPTQPDVPAPAVQRVAGTTAPATARVAAEAGAGDLE